MAVIALTSVASLKKLIGDDNYLAYTSPYVGTDADDYLEQFVVLGSEFVRDYLPQYDAASLANSPTIQRIATVIAAWQLSHERANPPHFLQLVNWAFDMLERYKTGQLFLHEATRTGNNAPGVINFEHRPENTRFPVLPDWYATAPYSLPGDRYHGLWFFYGPYLW